MGPGGRATGARPAAPPVRAGGAGHGCRGGGGEPALPLAQGSGPGRLRPGPPRATMPCTSKSTRSARSSAFGRRLGWPRPPSRTSQPRRGDSGRFPSGGNLEVGRGERAAHPGAAARNRAGATGRGGPTRRLQAWARAGAARGRSRNPVGAGAADRRTAWVERGGPPDGPARRSRPDLLRDNPSFVRGAKPSRRPSAITAPGRSVRRGASEHLRREGKRFLSSEFAEELEPDRTPRARERILRAR